VEDDDAAEDRGEVGGQRGEPNDLDGLADLEAAGYRCRCEHVFQVFGQGRHRRFYELDGSGEVSSSLSTLSSQSGRFRASATNAKTSSSGRAIWTDTVLVNTTPPARAKKPSLTVTRGRSQAS
jgi:hypothetical protein